MLRVPGGCMSLVESIDLAEAGLPPNAGGSLDQTQAFIEAWRLFRADSDYWKAKLKIPNG